MTIREEIGCKVNARLREGKPSSPKAVVDEMLAEHPLEDFRELLKSYLLQIAREALKSPVKGLSGEESVTGIMEGWLHLQRSYQIERDGKIVQVRIEDMTFEERRAKVAELRRTGKGAYEHAKELERYNRMQAS